MAGADLPEDLKERITFQGHDFFTPQTIVGADIYFFRWILHNWSDKYAIKILQNLASALRPNSLILICDDMMPERDDDGSGLSLAGLR